MTGAWIVWLAALAVALCAGQAALRSRRELRVWLGLDPLGGRRLARAAALALGAALLALGLRLALATPEQLSGEGADVVIAIDVSESMDVTDVAPSRLRRAQRTAERVVEAAKAERLALVVFSGQAFIALPLTQDRDAVLTYLRALDSSTISVRGTELGRGLAEAARAFDPRSSRPRSVLLLSDGEDFGPAPEPELAELRALGVRVVAVGYGTEEGGPVPGQAAQTESVRVGEPPVSQRNDGLLSHIASETGGAYFRESEDRPAPSALLPLDAAHADRAAAEPEPEPEPDRHGADSLTLVLAFAAVCLASELALSWAPLGSRRALRPALALVALALGGFGPSSDVSRGDAALAADNPADALSYYREAEATHPSDARLEVRIGNALYRLQRMDQAASAYLEALRSVEPDDAETRFAASFNLGNAFVAKQHFEEARDAYWTALLARPGSLEAQFNYEWAQSHVLPTPPVPPPEPSTAPKRDNKSSGKGDAKEPQPRPSDARPEKGTLDEREAAHWLDSLEEPVGDALRQEITNASGGRARARPGGKTW
ncbi:MAG TPA: VWA domain-containing protein [Myxococcota bacterium]|nr:VWA domain-containing protein [Myxococcota bacterium]